jgi:hypothetical protein
MNPSLIDTSAIVCKGDIQPNSQPSILNPKSSDLCATEITAAPDSSNIPTFLSAGLYGPAMPGEAMPPGSNSPLFTVSPPVPTMASSTWSMTTKLRPQNLANILEYLRTGRAYFSVSTDRIPEGELRGQMEVPMCYEAAMAPTSELPASWEVMNPYAFANVIVSRGGGDVSVFLQLPTDNGRKLSSGITKVFARNGAGASILEIQPRCQRLSKNPRCTH